MKSPAATRRNKMVFRKGQKVEIFKKSEDEGWEGYMEEYIGCHGIIVDPDTAINDPDALIEISLEGKGTHRFPQDCIRLLENRGQ
jgi:hypothetical protein